MSEIKTWREHIGKHEAYMIMCDVLDVLYEKEAIKKAVYERLKQAPSTGEWIPCSERLPETVEEVLVYLFGGNPYLAWFDGDEWQTNDFTVDDDERPTAWLRLPKPWEGEKDETD